MANKGTIGTIWAMPTFDTPRVVNRLRTGLDAWLALRRSRQALLRLDDRLLRDIGLTRADALSEARRSDLAPE